MHVKQLHSGFSTIGVCLVTVLLFCSRDYNPFSDLTNAKAHVLAWTFDGRDSVGLYSTGTLRVVVALSEEVDSFSVIAPKNRFWQDTVVRMSIPHASADGGPFTFSVSFFDTGSQKVTVRTFRSNGEVIPQEYMVRVVNPLLQEDITWIYGVPFVLRTPKVGDHEALYHWDFGPGRLFSSVSDTMTVLFTSGQTSGTGALWVTDLNGSYPTPASPFSYTFNDTSKPVIYCVNDSMIGDTVVTGDSLLIFRVYIIDNISRRVDSCAVNDLPFDLSNARTNVYTKIFKNMHLHTRQTGPLGITVFALDNQQFRNTATRSFWALYDSSSTRNPDAQVTILVPPKDSAIYRTRDIVVFGTADNFRSETMVMRMSVNDTLEQTSRIIVGRSGNWEWPANLSQNVNTIIVTAFDTTSRALAADTVITYFDPNALDTIKPMIWEILADGTPVMHTYYTSNSQVKLTVVAFDEGSRIQGITVNGTLLTPLDFEGYVWQGNSDTLVHAAQGNRIAVRARDLVGNVRDSTVIIYKNTPPAFVQEPEVPYLFCIDSAYTIRLSYYDKDNDPIEIYWPFKPAASTASSDGVFSWHPSASDLGSDSLSVRLWDGYEMTVRTWRFSVVECRHDPEAIRFATTESDFPAVLQAGVDTMKVRLETDSTPSTFVLRFSAWCTTPLKVFSENDTSPLITWAPVEADTGFRQLMMTVGNGTENFDTLHPSVRVVHRNEYPCSLSWHYTGTTTAQGELDLFSASGPDTLYFTIHDQDNILTESYTVTITQHQVRSVEEIKQRQFFAEIRPDSTRVIDTLRVAVSDRTGLHDSALFVIRFAPIGTNTVPTLLDTPSIPSYACIDSTYQFNIASYDPDNDVVDVIANHAPAGMSVSRRGLVQWQPSDSGQDSLVIRLYDHKEYSPAYAWPLTVLDCSNIPPGVRFLTSENDFPGVMQAGVDSLSQQLQTVPGTGVQPFVYHGRFMGNNATVLDNDTFGTLFWKPAIADTGSRVLLVSVRDKYFRADTITPAFTVVPPNQYPCSLSYTYSGTVVSPGVIRINSGAPPETLSFVIHDLDHPLTERYAVDIVKDRIRSSQTFTGTTRSFALTINATTITTVDTINVMVNDMTGSNDTAKLVVRYNAFRLEDIPNLSILMTAAEGVTTTINNLITIWEDTSSTRNQVFTTQSSLTTRPTLVENAVNGRPAIEFVRTMANDNLANLDIGTWANAPFTIFVVFRTTVIDNGRQTLVSSGAAGSVDFGISCNGSIGIFNESPGNNCLPTATANSNLMVQPNRWYIATYLSNSGVTFNNIQVQVDLNSTAASSPLTINMTSAGSGMLLGSGNYGNFTGGFSGMIATIVYFNRALTLAERQQVEQYLAHEYAITN